MNVASQFQIRGKLIPPPLSIEELPEYSEISTFSSNAKNGTSFFQQLLDHQDPSKGTFQMKYWWNAEYWEGPGSPVCEKNKVRKNKMIDIDEDCFFHTRRIRG